MAEERHRRPQEQLTEELQRTLETELEVELDHPLDESDRDRIKQLVKERVRAELLEKKRRLEAERGQQAKREEEFVRFALNVRLQHVVLALGCILLIVTGLPIKFHETTWAEVFFRLTGGLEVSRFIHRIGASLLILVAFWHSVWLLTPTGRREFLKLLPRPKDFFDFFLNIRHMLGLTEERPKFGRYSYIEKFDYWAVYWGMVIMIGSGLFLWFHNLTLAYLPKYMLDIAREAHSDEAMLATLAIVIWHWYNAHFNPGVFPFNPTIFTGRIPEHRMIEEHPLEYEELLQQREEQRRALEEQAAPAKMEPAVSNEGERER